ncbi:hypothetical protein [Pseudomonas sp.]|uniref:hypothetical protein n=1 Tax=Pseudomonas sp. TaxID=306 RepID=UPI001B139440|nr:hypothetical protein [Pseudomonas sp.]MBO9549824.1 hypothetical protein [Pseudomonas sp.]
MKRSVSPSHQRETAEQVRAQFRHQREQAKRARLKERENRQQSALALAPVIVDAIIDESDGTLARNALNHPLEVKIPNWIQLPEDGDTEYIYLQLSKTGDTDSGYKDVATEIFNGPVDSSIFPYPMYIPLNELPANGTLHVRYRHVNFAGSPAFSPARQLICDSVPPWGHDIQPEGVTFPQRVIDETYFATNPTGVAGVLPDDPYGAAGDIYELYFLDSWPEESDDFNDPVAKGTVAPGREILIPTENIRAKGDGRYFVAYYLWDKAGNKSRLSLPIALDVVLGLLPENLKAPRVPLAERDNIIDLKDAIERVIVLIEKYDNPRDIDRIAVQWGSTWLVPETVAGRPFPISIHVPPAVLRGEYTAAAGPQDTLVSYQVVRGEVAFPDTALSTNVDVDFSIVGPERPDPDPTWPDPVNDDLVAPTIRGKISNTDNVLTRLDINQNATLTFPLFSNIQNGYIVDFYWNGMLVSEAQYEVDVADPKPFTVEIPWKYIDQAGNNPVLPVYYTVRAGRDALNEQHSVTQLVNVDAVERLLPQPAFEGIDPGGWLNCGSLADPDNPGGPLSLRISIPDLSSELAAGDTLRMFWEPYIGSNDSDGERPVPGAAADWPVTLDDSNINGFIFHVEPYEDRLLPTFAPPNIRARARFRYAKDDGSISSVWIKHKLSLASGSDSCPLPPPRKS